MCLAQLSVFWMPIHANVICVTLAIQDEVRNRYTDIHVYSNCRIIKHEYEITLILQQISSLLADSFRTANNTYGVRYVLTKESIVQPWLKPVIHLPI